MSRRMKEIFITLVFKCFTNSASNKAKIHDLSILLSLKIQIFVQRSIWLKGDLDLRLSKFKLSKNLGSGGKKCGNTHLGFPLDQQLGKQRGKLIYTPC
jgi:hypothetical protein